MAVELISSPKIEFDFFEKMPNVFLSIQLVIIFKCDFGLTFICNYRTIKPSLPNSFLNYFSGFVPLRPLELTARRILPKIALKITVS